MKVLWFMAALAVVNSYFLWITTPVLVWLVLSISAIGVALSAYCTGWFILQEQDRRSFFVWFQIEIVSVLTLASAIAALYRD